MISIPPALPLGGWNHNLTKVEKSDPQLPEAVINLLDTLSSLHQLDLRFLGGDPALDSTHPSLHEHFLPFARSTSLGRYPRVPSVSPSSSS